MSKKMLINATHPEESRVATVEDGLLTDLDIESEGREMTRGNIYKATVVRVEQGLQAAFIDYGAERLGFLQMGELHPHFFKAFDEGEGKGRPRIGDLLRRGQEILVQVVKEERGTKGAALTTYLSLPGRYMVLMPDSDTKGVSRKIEEESQRKQLKEAMRSLDLPAQMGYIVRTAGIGQTKEELKRDFDYLVRVWQNIQELAKRIKAPALVYKESNLVIRSIRDYFTADMDEVLVDDPEVYEESRDFFQQVMPEYLRLVKLHQERRPIFSRYQIEEQIDSLARNKVPLPSGGSIVIDSTEALVAIDVNSGKMAGEQGVEGTAYKSNLEAAAEVGRQLRLRDLGGLIVIDFIDMRDRKHIREVEKTLKDSLKNDKARVTVGRISQFGLLEMSRQRIKATLAEGSYLSCPNCGGSGRVKSSEAQAVAFLRKLHAAVARGQVERVEGEVPIDVAHYLLNTKREELSEMERRYQVSIFIRARKSFVASQYELIVHKREKGEGRDEAWAPVTAASTPHLPADQAAEESTAVSEAATATSAATEAESATAEAVAEGDARKKRKRRRRKKKKGEGLAESEAAATAPDQEVPEEPEAEAAAEGGEVTPVEDEAGEATEEGQKRKRRRRRRKKKTPEATEESTAVASAEGIEPSAEPTPVPVPTAAPSGPPATAEAAAAAEPAAPAAETAPATAEPETPKRKRPARRSPARRAAPADATAAEPAAPNPGPAIAEPEPPAVTLPAEEKPAAKAAARRPRRKPVTKAEPAPEAVEVPAAPENNPPPAAPARKRAATAKKAATTTDTAEAAPQKTAATTATPKKRSPRKPAAPKAAVAEAAAEATPAAKKAASRTGTKKKTPVKDAAAAAGAPAAAESAAAKPASRPRRQSAAAKKGATEKAAAPAPADSPETTAEPPAGKPEAPKRTRRKKSEEPAAD